MYPGFIFWQETQGIESRSAMSISRCEARGGAEEISERRRGNYLWPMRGHASATSLRPD